MNSLSGFNEILQFVNLLLIPILWYVVKLEIRLTKIETMQGAEYQFLVNRRRTSVEEKEN